MPYLLTLFLFLIALPLQAQTLDVPIIKDCVPSQIACYPTSQVHGLRADGDGFLAVRTGPGTNFKMIGKLFNNTVVIVISQKGLWRGVELPDGRLGWVHSRWLRDLAG